MNRSRAWSVFRAYQKKRKSEYAKLLAFLLIVTLLYTNALSYLISYPFQVSTAEAATGDFSIYRDASGADSISADGTPLDVLWDTTVTADSNIALQGNSSDIDLSEGGKYFLTYSAWAYEGSAGGTNRRSLNSYLTLAGAPLAYGRGSGYIRDAEAHTTAYINGAAIINANSGDDLQVHLQRDDTNSGAGSETQPSTNGISLVKLPDNADYLRARLAATSSSINGNTSFTDVVWDTADEVDTDSFSFSPSSANITLKGDNGDYFLVTANVGLFVTAGGSTRQNYEMILTLGGVEIPGTRVTTYIRGTDGTYSGQLSYVGLITKTAAGDQTLNVEVRRESSGGATTVIMGNKSAISIMAVPQTADVIRLTDTTGTQTTSNSAVNLTFNNQQEVKTGFFGHSTTVNPERIEIDTVGDYLFFSTAYLQTTTSGNNRQPFRMNWLLNGVTQPRGAFGSFNRANATFSGGASGSLFLSGLTASDYVSLSHIDETSDAPVDATFVANRVALQGIALNDNFYGLDVIVSASGTQESNVDIPTTDFYMGGKFVIKENTASRNVNNITLTETGTIDASQNLENIKLFYDLDTSAPYDCASESYSGSESQFGSTDTNGFSGSDGISSFSDAVTISPTQALCLYTVLDVKDSSTDSQTIDIEIANPPIDVSVTAGGSVGPSATQNISGLTTVHNAELTQVHYHWRNDDGNETNTGATSIDGAEDTPAIGFANGETRRLRIQVSAEGSTTSNSVQFRLEYGLKSTVCSAISTWVDVGTGGGGDWDVVDTANLTDGSDTTLVTNPAFGALTAENSTRLTPNGGQKDASSQTGNITLLNTEYVELEYAIEPTVSAPQGNTYCFRLTDAGTPLRNYDIYPEGTISADIDVSAIGSHVSSVNIGTNNQYLGGTFVIQRSGTSRNLTSVTLTETGTIDASQNLENIKLFYDLDTTAPYDCASESYSGGESQFGGTDTDGFSAANGSSTFTDLLSVSSSQSVCLYPVVDISSDAMNEETINIGITDPSVEVIVTSSSVGPSTGVSPSGSVTVSGPVLTQNHYHWRNDDGSETSATSITDAEDTPITAVPKEQTRRLRIGVSNEGSVSSAATNYRLEYGTKVSTCELVGTWTDVGEIGGAWDMSPSANISDGNTTDISGAGSGEITNEGSAFIGSGALRETSSESGVITLASNEFTELEYSIEATEYSGYDTDYCFRVTDSGIPLSGYVNYPELTTREKQDFYVQRGTVFVSGTSTTLVAGVDYIAPSAPNSAFIRITNSQITGAGRSTGNSTQSADDVTAYIENPENIDTSITIARTTAPSDDTRVSWEIIEYVGVEGADNEVVVRDQGSISYGSSNLIATGTSVSGVLNDSKIVVFITGQSNENTGTSYNMGVSTANWSTDTDSPVFTRGASGAVSRVSYAVVEFTGANWNTERVEHTYTTAADVETSPISALSSLSRAFIHVQKRVGAGETGLDELGQEVWLSSIGSLSLRLESTVSTPALHTAVVWVIENTQTGAGAMDVQRSNGTLTTGTCSGVEPCAEAISITEVNEDNASVWVTNRGSGTGSAFPRSIMGVRILEGGNDYEFWRSDTGQPQAFRTEVVEWPVAETSIRQNYYRFYVDNNTLDPVDPWPAGAADLGENTSITAVDEPLGEGERVRLRMTLLINNATLPAGVASFKLQYGLQNTTCSAISVWNDIGAPGSGTIWRGYDGSVSDGANLATSTPAAGALNISIADVSGTYEEQNNTAVNPFVVDIGEDVEYDWLIEHNGASQRSNYCFRMVYSDGGELNSYINYPTLRTTGYTPVVGDWRWYDDENSETPSSPLAAENVAPIDVANENIIKLRVISSEVENAVGTNIKFALQYSQYADFSDGGTFVTSSSSCTENSIWCYADGGGIDNATIQEKVLTNSDACSAGAGTGCGIHNEAATTSSSFLHLANSSSEFEFTIQQTGARANGVYYFRLYDVGSDESLVASSTYPSLVTEGAQLVSTMNGVTAGEEVAGIVADVNTTATSIGFGTLPLGTSYEAVQRLDINTNATEGYQVLVYATQQLTNAYGDVIPPISGTNESPVGWTSGCSSGSTGCFGYHTTDATLANGSGRFSPIDSYAAISTTPQEIMHSSIPVNDAQDIVYRVQISELQPAGDYETSIVYMVIPVF